MTTPAPARLITVLVACFMLAILLSVGYTTWSVGQSQHRWCATLTLLDSADHRHPATTQAGRTFYADLHQLAQQYGCE